MTETVLGNAATLLTLVAFVPYVRGTMRGTLTPHVLSWLLWTLNTGTAFLVLLMEQGGPAAWPIGISAAITLCVTLMAARRPYSSYAAPGDRLLFMMALPGIPLWWLTADPFWTIILITAVELIGFGPTFRKCWRLPHAESIAFLLLMMLRNGLVLAALANRTFVTMLFPSATAAACLLLVLVILLRRRAMGQDVGEPCPAG